MENEIQPDTQTEAKATKCLNCGTEFEGKFCPECGQKADTGRFTMKFIFTNLLTAIFSNDGGVWFTLKNLFSRPGAMIVEILNGKRRKYFSPFPMLFLALTLYVLIFTATGSKNIDLSLTSELDFTEMSEDFGADTSEDSINEEQFAKKLYQLIINGYHFYLNHYTLCYMLTLPLLIIAARKSYGKENRKRYYQAEYIVTIVYAMSILVFYRCINNLIYPLSDDIYVKMIFLEPFAIIIALTVCFRKMTGFSWAKTAWRSTITVALYYILLGLTSLILGIIAIVFVFKYFR